MQKIIRCCSYLLIFITILIGVVHLFFALEEKETLLQLKKEKLKEINLLKKNIHSYNVKLIQIANDRDFFIYFIHKTYMLSDENEYYLNE
jgi:hypothetical protein